MRVLVVGGEPAFVKGTFSTKLKEHGVAVDWHWDWSLSRIGPHIPEGCGGVIVLKDMCGHSMYNGAKSLAQGVGVPFAAVPRKFSVALPVLQATGMIPAGARSSEQPTEEVIVEVVRHYVESESVKNHSPSQQEIQGAVQRSFGPTVSVSPIQIEQGREAATKDLAEWATIVVEDRPEFTNEALIGKLRDLLDEDMKNTLDSGALSAAIAEANTRMRKLVAAAFTARTPEQNKAVRDMRMAWLRRYLEARLWTNVTHAQVDNESRRIFGVRPDHSDTKRIRGELMKESLQDELMRGVVSLRSSEVKPEVKNEVALPPITEETKKERWFGYVSLPSLAEALKTGLEVLGTLSFKGDKEAVGAWVEKGGATRLPGHVLEILRGCDSAFHRLFVMAMCLPVGAPLQQAMVVRAHAKLTKGSKPWNYHVQAVAWATGRTLVLNRGKTMPTEEPMPVKAAPKLPVKPAPAKAKEPKKIVISESDWNRWQELEARNKTLTKMAEALEADNETLHKEWKAARIAEDKIQRELEALQAVLSTRDAVPAETRGFTLADLLSQGYKVTIEPVEKTMK